MLIGLTPFRFDLISVRDPLTILRLFRLALLTPVGEQTGRMVCGMVPWHQGHLSTRQATVRGPPNHV